MSVHLILLESSDPGSTIHPFERSLDAGWIAIVPERPVTVGGAERVGWWLVDASTGRVADQMDDGRGIELTNRVTVSIIGVTIVVLIVILRVMKEKYEADKWNEANTTLIDELRF